MSTQICKHAPLPLGSCSTSLPAAPCEQDHCDNNESEQEEDGQDVAQLVEEVTAWLWHDDIENSRRLHQVCVWEVNEQEGDSLWRPIQT